MTQLLTERACNSVSDFPDPGTGARAPVANAQWHWQVTSGSAHASHPTVRPTPHGHVRRDIARSCKPPHTATAAKQQTCPREAAPPRTRGSRARPTSDEDDHLSEPLER